MPISMCTVEHAQLSTAITYEALQKLLIHLDQRLQVYKANALRWIHDGSY